MNMGPTNFTKITSFTKMRKILNELMLAEKQISTGAHDKHEK